MTKRERHEIAEVVRSFITDECDEIRNAYKALHGSLKGLRAYIRKECVEFWSNCEPYLDKEYMDFCWMKVGNRIINTDDCWCFIRDGLKFDALHREFCS